MRLPNQSHEAIKDWARETVQKTYNFNFSNFDANLATAKPYFTDDAWDVYTQAFLKSDLVKAVKRDKMTVSVVVKEDPIIETTASGKGGEFAWKLILPVTLSFSGDVPTESKDLVMRVTVVRVPTVDNPKGLGVVQMSSASMQAGGK
jgi:intracellular multiplication protein IcmL